MQLENSSNGPADRITKNTFLSSLKTWYKKEGVECGVEHVSDIYANNYHETNIAVRISIIGDMPKYRARVLDDDGEIIKHEDIATGNMVETIEVIDTEADPDADEADNVTIFYPLNYAKDSKEEFRIGNQSALFLLVNTAFIATGDAPEGNKKSIIATFDEIKEALDGLEFTAFCGQTDFNGKKHNALEARL